MHNLQNVHPYHKKYLDVGLFPIFSISLAMKKNFATLWNESQLTSLVLNCRIFKEISTIPCNNWMNGVSFEQSRLKSKLPTHVDQRKVVSSCKSSSFLYGISVQCKRKGAIDFHSRMARRNLLAGNIDLPSIYLKCRSPKSL